MMEITLLKVRHGTELEAKKLLPYVLNSDAWGMEAFGCSRQMAEENEGYFRDAYKFSRTEFLRWAQEAGSFGMPEMKAYNTKLYDYLFRNQVPIYALERFPTNEKAKMEADLCKYLYIGQESLKLLDNGEIEKSLHYSYLSLTGMALSRKKRDENIADSIENAEEYLRSKYSHLKETLNIQFTASVGAWHSPEDYMKSPVKVVELAEIGLAGVVTRKFNKHVRTGAPIENRDLLAHAIGLKKNKGFTEEELSTLDFESLLRKYQALN